MKFRSLFGPISVGQLAAQREANLLATLLHNQSKNDPSRRLLLRFYLLAILNLLYFIFNNLMKLDFLKSESIKLSLRVGIDFLVQYQIPS